MPVAGHLVRPTRGSNEAGRLLPFYLVFHRVGFTELPPSPAALVSSYLAFSPLPPAVARGVGGVFSVALSLESLPLGVTQHPAPGSSDFPQASRGTPATVCPPRPLVSRQRIHRKTQSRNLGTPRAAAPGGLRARLRPTRGSSIRLRSISSGFRVGLRPSVGTMGRRPTRNPPNHPAAGLASVDGPLFRRRAGDGRRTRPR